MSRSQDEVMRALDALLQLDTRIELSPVEGKGLRITVRSCPTADSRSWRGDRRLTRVVPRELVDKDIIGPDSRLAEELKVMREEWNR